MNQVIMQIEVLKRRMDREIMQDLKTIDKKCYIKFNRVIKNGNEL